MIELVDAAIGAAGASLVAAVAGFIQSRRFKALSDERAQLIALGASYGVEYVPGEDIDGFRRRVSRERDERTDEARREWLAEQPRRRDAKGRFV